MLFHLTVLVVFLIHHIRRVRISAFGPLCGSSSYFPVFLVLLVHLRGGGLHFGFSETFSSLSVGLREEASSWVLSVFSGPLSEEGSSEYALRE